MTIVAGTSSKSSIAFADGTSGQTQYEGEIIYDHNTNFLRFGVGGSARMIIDSVGRVGIGATPSAQNVQGDDLVVGDGTGDRGITIYSGGGTGDSGNLFFADSGNAVMAGVSYQHETNQMQFRVNDANRMEITSAGKVGIGETTPEGTLHIRTGDSGLAPNSAVDDLFIENNGDHAGMTIATNSNIYDGRIYFANQDSVTDGRIVYDNGDRALVFWTAAAERVRIESSGDFQLLTGNLLGNSSDTTELGSYTRPIKRIRMSQGGELHFGDTSTTNFLGITEGVVDNFADQDYMTIYYRSSLQIRGSASHHLAVSLGHNATSWTNGSDRRIKENITDIGSVLDKVNQLRPITYKRIQDPEIDEDGTPKKTHPGLIAQEVLPIFPLIVDGKEEDATQDEDGIWKDTMGLTYTDFIPYLIKSIQELSAKVTALENA
jgi:hypothetical protein